MVEGMFWVSCAFCILYLACIRYGKRKSRPKSYRNWVLKKIQPKILLYSLIDSLFHIVAVWKRMLGFCRFWIWYCNPKGSHYFFLFWKKRSCAFWYGNLVKNHTVKSGTSDVILLLCTHLELPNSSIAFLSRIWMRLFNLQSGYLLGIVSVASMSR